ncbi:MAG: hypothetical protein WAW41_12170, partial [Methylobacter sp.]
RNIIRENYIFNPLPGGAPYNQKNFTTIISITPYRADDDQLLFILIAVSCMVLTSQSNSCCKRPLRVENSQPKSLQLRLF